MRPDDRIQKCNAGQGFRWIVGASFLLQQGAGSLVGVGALWLLLSMVAVVPLIGQLILAVVTPLLTAGVLAAFDEISADRYPRSSILLAGWNRAKARPGLLLLGVWTIIGAMISLTFLASWLGSQFSEQALEAALQAPENLGAMIEQLTPGAGLYGAIAVVVLVVMGLYFAIPLAFFGEASPWSGVRASIKAIVINTPAFLVFGLGMALVVGAFIFVLISVVGLVSQLPGTLGMMLAQILILVLSMTLQIFLAGAQYLAFCDVFGWSAKAPD